MKGLFFKSKFSKLAFSIVLFLISGEFFLRMLWGFCNAPLYIASEKYEYITAPNQEGQRFGNRYYFNSYSQRSAELDATKSKILGLGDSVLYGGVQSDQDSLATSIFNKENKNFQMLNIATGSWGPDNCAAYLKEHGTFDAKKMLLVTSSHDVYDTMDFMPVVGTHPSYPQKQYVLAWWELVDRYLIPRLIKYYPTSKNLDPDAKVLVGIQKKGATFNPGFDELKKIGDSLQIPLIIYLHAEKSELQKKCYNPQGAKIIQWATENNVPLIKGLDYSFDSSDYRDQIHINNSGQRKLAKILIENL
ncbi:hypothetical protein CSC80_04385 [Maribacter sp. 6B07]|uniref:hypothetical protein n=1 Tax=Maribacter sp. 6B07 TaxID=2045442 RepID=UPI000C08A339|nr:hypothetical protein [Maribacter sp. 6B07]PHN94591.1 hypothetical protein CSC80_04385 [Maribacter sp. 6B07]